MKLAFARKNAIKRSFHEALPFQTMKKHHVIALYTLLFACALSVCCWYIRGWNWAWALLASVKWQVASLGLCFERKWAAPFTFGLFGFALAMTLVFGFLTLIMGHFTPRDSIIYLIACLALFLPMKLLNSREVKETFGLRIDDPEPENQITENEQG